MPPTENIKKNHNPRKYKNYFGEHLKIFLGIACAVLLFMLLRQCDKKQDLHNEIESVRGFLSDSISHYKNKNGQLVAEKKALQGSNTKLTGNNQVLQVLLSKQIDSTRQLTNLVKNFKTIDAAGNITFKTKLEDIDIPFDEPIDFTFSRQWQKQTPDYLISGFTTETGTTIARLNLNTIISFGIGKKQTGFFKTEYRFEATSSNPYIHIIGLDGASFTQKRKRLGLSLYAGYGLGRDFTVSPQIGIGITYNVIRF